MIHPSSRFHARKRRATTKARVQIGFVGCGYWGQKLLRTFSALDAARVLACHDRNPRRLAELSTTFPNVTPARTYQELLRHPRIDAIVIATPTSTHVRLVSQALRAGKHVFVEKPLASTLAEARRIRTLAQRHRRVLLVGHVFAYHPAIEALRRRLRQKRLGRVVYLRCTRTHLGPARTDVDVLWDVCSHDVSIVLDLLGALPREVRAEGVRYQARGLHDAVFLTLRFPGGQTAHLHGSWLSAQKQREVVVIGERGAAVFDDTRRSGKLTWYDPGITLRRFLSTRRLSRIDATARAEDLDNTDVSPLERECRHFVECIRWSRTPLTNVDEGVNVVRVLDAAQRSLARGGTPMRLAP
jgi:predicted dehydrogenase